MTAPTENDGAATARHPSGAGRRGLLLLLAVAVLAALGAGGWMLLRPAPLLPMPPQPQAESGRSRPFDIVSADAAAILAARPAALQVYSYQPAPRILVLSFPTLHEQGRMLDRMGAFVEKTGLPHDRVLDEADLQAAIRLSGDTEDTYYYGHDYRAADMARFFALADRDGIALHPEEETLRRLLIQQGLLVPGAVGAIITIPPVSVWPEIDEAARATILEHELSHGAYFTDPAFAAYARDFWQNVLTEAQRAGFRRFLGTEGYDTTNEDLMLNETQAYLVHTPDPRFFRPALAGLSDAEAARLRQVFVAHSPAAWLDGSGHAL
jgi:hypothetical protein